MKKTVTVTMEFDVTIPDEKVSVILDDYRAGIASNGTEEDLFKAVAYQNGVYDMTFVEGVGDLREEGIVCEELGRDEECS